ncbi:MAG TPA: hypothetical protein VGM73_09025 [Candidatus Didemnitutus sp.]|jgi:hypothetical protein
MGLFDGQDAKKNEPEPGGPAGADRPMAAGGVLPRLAAARERLDSRDLPAAMTIYEEVLATAGARADVLVSLSGELGAHGYAREVIELVAPRYDAQKHGPAAGLNLLQAYLATRDLEPAQHLLDLLFALQRPELEDRLLGFSNVIADLMASVPVDFSPANEAERKVNMITISKPMWAYGLEAVTPPLVPAKEGKMRRVVFAQWSVPGLENAEERSARAEDDLGRLVRGLPLVFAEMFNFSAGYEPTAAVGVTSEKHYILFPVEWLAENVRQLHETTAGGLDYAITGAVRNRNDDYELHLRIWEVRKSRELKSIKVRWDPMTADAVLGQLLGQLRGYMEWTALPPGAALPYAPPAAPLAYTMALGSALTLFLGEKNLLAPDQVATTTKSFLPAAGDIRGRLALLTGVQRLRTRGAVVDAADLAELKAWLASDEARALGLAGIEP